MSRCSSSTADPAPGAASGPAPGPTRDVIGWCCSTNAGAGAAAPNAADPTTDLATNTTGHLVADMERLRTHLGIGRWMLVGGSSGSTLILAYAQCHPERVAGIVITGVTTSRRRELDWLYRDAGRFAPAAQERFVGHVPEASGELYGDGGILDAYARRAGSPDDAVQAAATAEWCRWEDALIAHEDAGAPGSYGDRPDEARRALVRICAHYFSHLCWLGPDELLRGAHRLTGIPAVLLHGRLDLSSPLETAWALARAWPDAELEIVDDAGHTGSPAVATARSRALSAIADRAIWR